MPPSEQPAIGRASAAPTRQQVVALFSTMLGRPPENDETLNTFTQLPSIEVALRVIADSDEYKARLLSMGILLTEPLSEVGGVHGWRNVKLVPAGLGFPSEATPPPPVSGHRPNPSASPEQAAFSPSAAPPNGRFHVFGDSHSNLYAAIAGVEPHYLGAVTMHRVGRDGLASLQLGTANIENGEPIGVVFGEIDIRVHVATQRDRTGRAPEEILDALVAAYVETLRALQSLYDRSKIAIFSAPPPAGLNYPLYDPGYPRNGSDAERARWAAGLNQRLHDAAMANGFHFVDQSTPFMTADGLLDLEASDDGVHIRQSLAEKIDLSVVFQKKSAGLNILYYSVHQILEDDEVRLLKSLGHNVCCLGANGRDGAVQGFRLALDFNETEIGFYDQFELMGGQFRYDGNVETFIIPETFVDLFDLVIVMHDLKFIAKFWPELSRRPVVWRTIGVGVEHFEPVAKPFRDQGLQIVRYSPLERQAPDYQGDDAVIRFYKPSDVYAGWTGETNQILTFCHTFTQRYALDASEYIQIVEDLPAVLGGMGNEGIPGALGIVSADEQLDLYRRSRVYLYGSNLITPYTLNFIEAWMTGTPIVVYAPYRRGMFFEIDSLITDGVDGFVCRDVKTARMRSQALLADTDLARRISEAGRSSALRLFSEDACRGQWSEFLSRFERRSTII